MLRFSSHLLAFGLILSLSGCDAIDLIQSVGTILKPSTTSSPTPAPVSSVANGSSPTPAATPGPAVDVVLSSDPTPVSIDWNLARQPGAELIVSSTLNATYDKSRLLDGKLTTSWFAAEQDIPSKGKLPTLEVDFAQPVGILSVNLRGDRERQQGLQIQELSMLITSAQGILLNETIKLPDNAQDVNLVLRKPVDGASSLRLTVTRAKADTTPGLSEIEVLGRH